MWLLKMSWVCLLLKSPKFQTIWTKLIYECLFLESHCLIQCRMKGRDRVGSMEVFQVGKYLDSSK